MRHPWILPLAVWISLFFLGRDTPRVEAAPRGARKVATGQLRVFLLDPHLLADTRRRVQSGDRELAAAIKRLNRDAEKAVQAGVYSVTTVNKPRPSGDLHDYALHFGVRA